MSMEHCAAAAMDMTNPPNRTGCVIPFIPRVNHNMRQEMSEGGTILPINSEFSAAECDVSASVIDVKDHIQNISRNLELTLDEEVNRVILIVCNLETQEVIREISAEAALTMSVTLLRRRA